MNKTYEELQDELHMCHEHLSAALEREQALINAAKRFINATIACDDVDVASDYDSAIDEVNASGECLRSMIVDYKESHHGKD